MRMRKEKITSMENVLCEHKNVTSMRMFQISLQNLHMLVQTFHICMQKSDFIIFLKFYFGVSY